ncbi:MAG: antibiotic biosynthesis monooxygenase [Planctomycetaceae bacterium]
MSEPLDCLPDPPYYAVIFTSRRALGNDEAYAEVAERMHALASRQPGFLGLTSLRNADDVGVTVSYWSDALSMANWRRHVEHRIAQEQGKRLFYEEYRLEVCRVERTAQHPPQQQGEIKK